MATWVQVRDNEAENKGSIGFHWDKDEDLVDSCGLSLHPQLSTVTYLSSGGAPTMVCDRRTPLDYADQDEVHHPSHDFHVAYLSHPVCDEATGGSDEANDDDIIVPRLKHIAFDGRLLHGAPAEFGRPAEGRRYTFLVNVWLGYSPLGLSPMDEESIETAGLSLLPITFPLGDSKQSSTCIVDAVKVESSDRFESTFGPTGTEHVLSFGRPSIPGIRTREAYHEVTDSGRADDELLLTPPYLTTACTLRLDLSAEGTEGRLRPAPRLELNEVPSIEAADATWGNVRERYCRAQILVVRGGALPADGAPPLLSLSSLRRLYSVDREAVENTWNVENGPDDDSTAARAILSSSTTPTNDASDTTKRRKLSTGAAATTTSPSNNGAKCLDEDSNMSVAVSSSWYVSFVLNQSKALDAAKDMLPFLIPSCFDASNDDDAASHTSNVWFFFGRNHDSAGMSGRAEHTDKISHSGTWHAQQSGAKVWYVRPYEDDEEWAAAGAGRHPSCADDSEPLRAELRAGDLLLVNTRLWRHRTEIPNSVSAADGLSFSYARDFYLDGRDNASDDEVDMTNLDDIWATTAVAEGTEVADVGDDAELLTRFAASDEPNCRLEGAAGDVRVVAARNIAAGESLTLPEGSTLPSS